MGKEGIFLVDGYTGLYEVHAHLESEMFNFIQSEIENGPPGTPIRIKVGKKRLQLNEITGTKKRSRHGFYWFASLVE